MTVDVNAVVSFARAQIGKPYRWGATGPDSYDCSGLTQAAYASVGVHLQRVTSQQVSDGPRVAKKDLQLGDLVFPDPGHVQIYSGNGHIVEAPRTGLYVREVPMWGFYTAVRPGTSHGGSVVGTILGGLSPITSLPGVAGAVGGVAKDKGISIPGLDQISQIAHVVSWFGQPNNLARLAYGVTGGVLAGMGLLILIRKGVGVPDVIGS